MIVPTLIGAVLYPIDHKMPLEDVLGIWDRNEVANRGRLRDLLVLLLKSGYALQIHFLTIIIHFL